MSGLANKSPSILLPSAVRNSTQTLSGRTNRTHLRGLWALTITSNPGAGETLTLTISAEPVGGGATVVLGTITTTTSNGTWAVSLGSPGSPPNAFSVASPHIVPTRYTVTVQHSGGGNWTYQLDETLIP